jgi:uncharacterized protein YoxC
MSLKELLAKVKAALAKEKGGDDEALALLEEEHQGLITKRDELLDEVKKLKAKVRSFDGIDPEEVKDMKERMEELEEAASKGSKDVEAAVQRTEAKYKKELEKAQSALAAEHKVTTQLLVENGLTDALAKVGVTEAGLKYARSYFAPRVQIEADGEERVARIGDQKLAEAVAEWAKTDEAKLFIRASASTGGGASGGAGGGSSAKQMARAEFDKLSADDKMKFVKEGGRVTDAA